MTARSRGIGQALAAYLLWGLLPIYWKSLVAVPAPEILAHRITWSFVFLAVLIGVRREWPAVRGILAHRRTLALYSVAAVLLATNWLTYIHGVNTNRIVETSLGYYINPLVSVGLGVVFLRERLRRTQWLAISLAGLGVAYLTIRVGHFPWIAAVLAVSFGLYGLAKKRAPAGPIPGLAFETGVLVVPAVVTLGFWQAHGDAAFGHAGGTVTGLLLLSGFVTTVPLVWFSSAVRVIDLTTLGLLQYSSPTCGLLVGVFLYREPFDRGRLLGFGVIWLGLAAYWLEGVWRARALRYAAR